MQPALNAHCSGVGEAAPIEIHFVRRAVHAARICPQKQGAAYPEARAELGRLWHEFDGGKREALDRIEQICLTHDKDAALAAFACRLREAGPGGAVALREK